MGVFRGGPYGLQPRAPAPANTNSQDYIVFSFTKPDECGRRKADITSNFSNKTVIQVQVNDTEKMHDMG